MNQASREELNLLAVEALDASKQAKTFDERYKAASVFALCKIALELEQIALLANVEKGLIGSEAGT